MTDHQAMKSSLEHPLPPTYQQFDMKLYNQTVCLKCETHINQNALVSDEYRDQPLVQNYYCYKVNKQLVKVTKIRIGKELITLIDRLGFKKYAKNQKNRQKNEQGAEVALATEASILEKKEYLSVKTQKILKYFIKWVKQSKPQIDGIFQEILGNCASQTQLKTVMRENAELRASFLEFKQKMRQENGDKSVHRILAKWAKEIVQQKEEQGKMQDLQQQLIKNV